MSLNRVVSIDGLELERDADSTQTSYRRMSFSPVDHWVPDEQSKQTVAEPIATFDEVPKRKRVLQCAIAVIYCLLSAGVVFGNLSSVGVLSRMRLITVFLHAGYAAIKPVLIREGVYVETCSKEELEHGTTPCYGQEIRSLEDFYCSTI
jgi:hypothetical protein